MSKPVVEVHLGLLGLLAVSVAAVLLGSSHSLHGARLPCVGLLLRMLITQWRCWLNSNMTRDSVLMPFDWLALSRHDRSQANSLYQMAVSDDIPAGAVRG